MFGPLSQVVGARDRFLDRLLKKRERPHRVQLNTEEGEGEEIISFPISGSRIYDFIKQDRPTLELIGQSYKLEMERRSVLWGNVMQERVALWFRESFGTEELLDTQMYFYAPDPTISSQPDYLVKLGDSWYFIEIKCPYRQSLPNCDLLTVPNKVYCQVQSHLNCYASNNYQIEIRGCLVIHWSLLGATIYLVQRDEKFWQECMLPAIQSSKKKVVQMMKMKIFRQSDFRDETESLTSQVSGDDLDSGVEEKKKNVLVENKNSEEELVANCLMDQRILAYQTRERVQRLYVFVFHTREVPQRRVAGRVQPAKKLEKFYQHFDTMADLAEERINKNVALGANLLY